MEPPRPPELDGEDQDTPYSLDLFLTAADDMYDVVPLDIEDETLFEDDGWQAYRASVLAKRMSAGNHVSYDEVRRLLIVHLARCQIRLYAWRRPIVVPLARRVEWTARLLLQWHH